MKVSRRSFLALASIAGFMGPAHAQSADWPARPLKIVVPYAGGALTDVLARLLADHLRPTSPSGVVVENKPGAGTLLAASAVAKAPPDGYTIMLATSTTLGISQALFAQPAARIGDLTGIAMLGAVTLFLVAAPQFPASNLAEAVAAMKVKPDSFTMASPGNGTPHHLLFEMLKRSAGVSVRHIPYLGIAQALPDLLAGRTDLMILDATQALPLGQAGKVKVLATTAPRRTPLLPGVPALAESFPEINLQVWQGVVGPNGVPADIAARLERELAKVTAAPAFRTRLQELGVEPIAMSPGEFNAMIRRDEPRWAELVKASGAKVD